MSGASPLAWFRHVPAGGRPRLGLRSGGECFDLGRQLDELASDVEAALAAGALSASGLRKLAGGVRASDRLAEGFPFAVPVPRPGKILCLGKNFAAHAREMGSEPPEQPLFFAKLAETLLPHRGTVLIPRWLGSRVDHEVELCVIVRSTGKYVPAARAMDLAGGYTVLVDVTARKLQGDDREQRHPWLRSKSFDTFCPVGPFVRAAEELGPEPDLAISLTVNGEPRQASRTSLMITKVAAAIEYLSRHTTLRPGDLIAMGTPEGVAPLQHGDVMRAEIESIGVLENPIAREDGAPA
jgi:2-keto-4-pentenoate hydratase/2-oxohepta-3-ene-1,7-dioic acid hydratase in catechol pathway